VKIVPGIQHAVLVVVALASWAGCAGAAGVNAVAMAQPLTFEQNVGQENEAVSYLSCGQGYTLFLTPSEAVLVMAGALPARRLCNSPTHAR
jgi:hypothetical protein